MLFLHFCYSFVSDDNHFEFYSQKHEKQQPAQRASKTFFDEAWATSDERGVGRDERKKE
jgi:hypothetical protein